MLSADIKRPALHTPAKPFTALASLLSLRQSLSDTLKHRKEIT
jgi:hypothetical protein